jgi:hypothetical protein
MKISFSQSKKEHIEVLTNMVDSLNSVLISVVNNYNQKKLDFNNQQSTLQNDIDILNITLDKTKEELSKKEIELNKNTQDLLDKSLLVKVLENQIKEKEILIENLKIQFDELKVKQEQLSLNAKIEIIAAPSFSISNPEIIEMTDSKMIDPCPEINLLGEEGPEICKKQVTRITYFKKGNVIRFFACVGYSFQGSRWDPGQDGFILAEYNNSNWTIIDFYQVPKRECCWGNSLEIEDQNILGINSFGYSSLVCTTVNAYEFCTSYIIGFVNDEISVLLEDLSKEYKILEENERVSNEEDVINWKYKYKVIPNNNDVFSLERKHLKFDKIFDTKILNYNSQSMKFE